ncbi:YQGE family putative transporter [Natronobacillus azotifigens]|uniref:MFS transporter n=1 Tax=Natronobacillus azotifigens TaxID=472978 RepID=A0A9J6RF35_9BACI|nr:MFS transporter [Natronobacillus azotifigens]MCZ0704053.1 MFS transporter [Natronobacillus azotifigens]
MRKPINLLLGNKIEVNRDLLLLLVIGGLYSLAIFLSNTFVNIYLWRQSNDYLAIALYNLSIYIMQPLTFVVAGRIAKKLDRTIVLRLGVSFLALFFLTVLIVGGQAAQFNILLGSLLGIGYGFYWLAFNVLTFEITEPDTRDFFNGFLGLMQSFAGMIGPVLAGYVISVATNKTGYTIIFSLSFGLFICAVVSSFFLKKRPADGDFFFRKVLKFRKTNKNWRNILSAHILQGLREGVFIFVISIWVFVATGSEFALGKFNLVLSGCSFFSYYLATRIIKPHFRKRAILIAGLNLFAAIGLIVFQVNYTTLLVYGFFIGLSYPFFTVPYVSLTYDVIGMSEGARELRIEYIVVREFFLNAGRIISVSLFILATQLFVIDQVIPYLLLSFGAGHFLIYFFVRKIQLVSE